MSPDDQERVRKVLEKKYLFLDKKTTLIAEKQAKLINDIEDFIQSIGLSSRDIVLSCIIGQVYMDTTSDNDTAIAELKSNKLIKKTREYIINIDNVLTKGE